jgi:hypothetical protein
MGKAAQNRTPEGDDGDSRITSYALLWHSDSDFKNLNGLTS